MGVLTGLKATEDVYPKLVGKDGGKLVVDLEPGNRKRVTEDEWEDLKCPGAGASFRLQKAVEALSKAIEAVPAEEALAALEPVVKTLIGSKQNA